MTKLNITQDRRAYAALACACGLLQAAMGATLAYYDFSDHAEGSEASGLVNQVDAELYAGTVMRRGDQGSLPVWANNVPGNAIFSDATCATMITTRPQSILLTSEDGACSSGAYIDLNGLGAALAASRSFTVEWFWKPVGDQVEWLPIVSLLSDGLCLNAGIGYENQAVYVTGSSKSDTDLIRRPVDVKGPDAGAWTWNKKVSQMGWRHWAVVFENTGSDQVAKLYYDHDLYRVVSNHAFKVSHTGIPALRFGAEIMSSGSVGSGRHGYISSIRVSDTALEPAQMMQMGVNAFYPLTEGADKNGQRMTAETQVANSAVPGTFPGAAAKTGDNYSLFSDDRPGRYIFASSSREQLLATDVMCLQNRKINGWSADGGYLTLTQLAGRLMTVANQRKHAFTIECFVKRESDLEWGRSLFEVPAESGTWRAIDDCNTITMRQDWNTSGEGCTTEGETRSQDGKWHHVAFVFTPNEANEWGHKNVDIYVDYAKSTGQKKYDMWYGTDAFCNQLNDNALPFGSGINGNGGAVIGKICAPRICSGARTPADFMVAVDTLEKLPSDAGFRWRFENGTSGEVLASVADSGTGEKWAMGEVTTFGTEAQAQPLYVTAAGFRKVVSRTEGDLANSLGVDFSASSASGKVFLQTMEWCGLPYLHPKSWTLEFFAKADANEVRSGDVLLAGRGRKQMKDGGEWYDFALVLQPDGRLGLKGYRMSGDADRIVFSFADIGVAADAKWHAYAVSYDGNTRTISVFQDARLVFSQVLATALSDSLKGRYIFGSGCGQGPFVGCMDEVRFVGRVLSSNELYSRNHLGFKIIVR